MASRLATWWRGAAIVVLLAGGGGVSWRLIHTPGPEQPIAFNHALHVGSNVQCAVCHPHYAAAAAAGMPTAQTCRQCHEDVIHIPREKRRLQAFYDSGQPIPWRRVLELPDHVYFSHRRHVTLGRLMCRQCHGDVASQSQPLSESLKPLRMADCIDCHTRMQARTSLSNINECTRCHR